MKSSVGDYVLVRTEKKPTFVQITHKTNGTTVSYRGVIDDKTRAHAQSAQTVEFENSDIVANLGKKPDVGSAYGTVIEPFVKHLTVKPWGHVYILRDVTESEEASFVKHLKKCGNRLVAEGLDRFMPEKIETELRPGKGKYVGFYKPSGAEHIADVVTHRPHEFSELPHTIFHEHGHHLIFCYMSNTSKSKWIKLYHKAVSLQNVDKAKVKRLHEDFVNSGELMSEFVKNAEKEDQLILNEIVGYISGYHNLSLKDLDVLISSGKVIQSYWPTKEVEVQDLKVYVSDYGLKNWSEFFCECFAFHMLDKEMPKFLKRAVIKTLKAIKRKG